MPTNDGCSAHSIQRLTGPSAHSTPAMNSTDVEATDTRAVEYTSIGSDQRSWLAKRKKPVSIP